MRVLGSVMLFLLSGQSAPVMHRNLAVAVELRPHGAVFRAGEPLLCDVVITNKTGSPIWFSTFSRKPNKWNGETASLVVVDIYRGTSSVPRPAEWSPSITPPRTLAGRGSYAIAPSESMSITIDLRKWKVLPGWSAGQYRVNVRAENIRLDDYAVASVTSPFAAIEIRP
jgi:hypothetical protein